MNLKRWVPILIGIVLIAFGVGFFSLLYNDNFYMDKSRTGNSITVFDKNEMVKIGPGGIEVKDGDSHVIVSWKGIKVRDGNDLVDIGWDGIRINESGKTKVNIGGNWPLISNKNVDLFQENVNVEEFLSIDGVNNIYISSTSTDIKVIEEDREDVKVYYHGSMRTNITPSYEFVKKPNGIIDIKVDSNDTFGFVVTDSDVILEVIIPKDYNEDIDVTTVSGDLDISDINAKAMNISSTSGNIELENIHGDTVNIATTSGDIEIDELTGELNITTTSGDVELKDYKSSNDIKMETISGNIFLKLDRNSNYFIEASTTSGDFISRIDMSISEHSRNFFKAVIGSGENLLKINTVSGDVYFSKR